MTKLNDRDYDVLAAENEKLREANEDNIRISDGVAAQLSKRLAEITALKAALGEALDLAESRLVLPSLGPDGQPPLTWSCTVTIDSGKPYRDKVRIAELRRLL